MWESHLQKSCDKKTVKKDLIEQQVVYLTQKNVLSDENIDHLAYTRSDHSGTLLRRRAPEKAADGESVNLEGLILSRA